MDAFRKGFALAAAVWLALVAPVLAGAEPPAGQGAEAMVWQIETVDAEGEVGRGTALALDSQGRPHIAYRDATNRTLKYAYKVAGDWVIETVPGAGSPSLNMSLQLDGADQPHIAFSASTPEGNAIGMRYVHRAGTSWHVETIEPYMALDVSLALRQDGQPCLAYRAFASELNDEGLKFACRENGTWQIELIGAQESLAGSTVSLAFDPDEHPAIAYSSLTAFRYATRTGTDWTFTTIEPSGDAGGWASLRFDSTGQPHISYYYMLWNVWDLKYATWTGDTWQTEPAFTEGIAGSFSTLLLTPADEPLITFFDLTNGSLRLAQKTPEGWTSEVIDSGNDNRVGEYSSAALAPNGQIHVSYFNATAGDLKYAISMPPGLAVRAYLPVMLR